MSSEIEIPAGSPSGIPEGIYLFPIDDIPLHAATKKRLFSGVELDVCMCGPRVLLTLVFEHQGYLYKQSRRITKAMAENPKTMANNIKSLIDSALNEIRGAELMHTGLLFSHISSAIMGRFFYWEFIPPKTMLFHAGIKPDMPLISGDEKKKKEE